MIEVLGQRELNRATLARQYLPERADLAAIDAIEHLGGMQSQALLAEGERLCAFLGQGTSCEIASGPPGGEGDLG